MVSPSFLLTRAFWLGAADRAARLSAWVFLATLGVPQIGDRVGFDVLHAGWATAASYGAGAAVVSLLISIVVGGSGIGPTGSQSFVDDRPSPQDMAAGQQLVRQGQAGRHRDDGIDVALDGARQQWRHDSKEHW